MMSGKAYWTAAAFLVMSLLLQAAPSGKYYFTSYTTAVSDLPYDMVNVIVQDKDGFIWIGTSAGVCRFDGERFRVWHKRDMGLNSDYVVSMAVDNDGNVWAGTDRGLSVYDRANDRFSPFELAAENGNMAVNKVNALKVTADGRIWFSVNSQGMFVYDPASGRLKNYFFENGKQVFPVNIRTFTVSSDNRVYLDLYYRGIFVADSSMTSVKPLLPASLEEKFHRDDIVEFCFHPLSDKILYLATARKGLCMANLASGEYEVLVPGGSGFVPEDLYMDDEKKLWMPTSSGIYIYDTATGESEVLQSDSEDCFSLNDSHVFTVFRDSDNGLWVGTNVGGVNYSGMVQRRIDKNYMAGGRTLGDCLVRGMAAGRDGIIWVTTEKSGLLRYDSVTRELERFDIPGLNNSFVPVCEYDGFLWMGTMNGLVRLSPSDRRWKIYRQFEMSGGMTDSKVFSLFRMTGGDFLVGTTLGLMRYVKERDSFEPLPGTEGKFITDITEDKSGRLWVATYADGIICYDTDSSAVVSRFRNNPDNPESIPSNKIFSITVDSKGIVWAASFDGGFFCYYPAEGAFKSWSYATCPDLKTDVFFKIIEDDNGIVWVSSDKGLISLNPENGALNRYTKSDGLLDNEFKNCGLKTPDGNLYFGSKNGFIRFSPKDLQTGPGDVDVLITEFRVADEPVLPGPDSPIRMQLNISREIRLRPNQNSFGFKFAVPGAAYPGAKNIMCLLEGYDKDWRRADNDNSVSYYNVPSGNYILKLRCSGPDGVWKETAATVNVIVRRRLWQSPLAVILYLLVLLAITACVSMLFYKRAVRAERRKRKEFEKRREREQYEDKMKFFSNVVHEIKSPLSLIKAPLMNIMSSGSASPEVMEDLEVIRRSSDYLDRLVKELLEFVRIEKGGYKLSPRKIVDVADRLGFLCSDYAETARTRNLVLRFSRGEVPVRVKVDEPALDKILNNLLNNAVKYAETEINVEIKAEGGSVCIDFSNDGPVIPDEYREEIFKPFVMYATERQPYSQSFGIGLSLARTLAELHDGSLVLSGRRDRTMFELRLPLCGNAAPDVSDAPQPVQDGAVNILLVEDNAELSSYLLRKLGATYNVISSGTAESGLEVLKSRDIDLVITDIALPGMNGVDFCGKITTDIELSHIPVIVVSAISSESTKISCIEHGASIYIEKPFTLEYMKACIKGILAKREALKKSYMAAPGSIDVKQYNLVDADKDFLHRLEETVNSNLSDPAFSSRQMEEALFLSRSTLIRKVKALLGTTPNDYLKKKRLAEAARLLADNNVRVNEVCYAVGFNSPSWFAKCFKEEYGALPAEYRNKAR